MARRKQWEIDADAEMTGDLTDNTRIGESGNEKLTNLGLPVMEKPYDSSCPHCTGQPSPKDPRDTMKLIRYRDSLCDLCAEELRLEISRLYLWNAVLQDDDEEFDMSYP